MSQEVTQPNPLRNPDETLRRSEEVVIVTGDMELEVPRASGTGTASPVHMERYPLRNVAVFTVVSRDRLRFRVQLEHKWEEWADLDGWEAYLIDGDGQVYRPDSVEAVDSRAVTHMWDEEVRSVQRDAYGNIVDINDDGHLDRRSLGSISIFRGGGDVAFYRRDIFTPDTRSLTLVLVRKGVTYRFTWNFEDRPDGSLAGV